MIVNEKVFIVNNESRCLIETIRQRKKNWIGHELTGTERLWTLLVGRMLQKNRVDRQRENVG